MGTAISPPIKMTNCKILKYFICKKELKPCLADPGAPCKLPSGSDAIGDKYQLFEVGGLVGWVVSTNHQNNSKLSTLTL